MAETVFAGEEIEEFAGGEPPALLAALTAPVAGLGE